MIRPPPSSTLFPYPPLSRSDIGQPADALRHELAGVAVEQPPHGPVDAVPAVAIRAVRQQAERQDAPQPADRKSTRLNSSHSQISYAVFCLKKKKKNRDDKLQ